MGPAFDALDARPLAGTEGAAFPFWSPDSRALGFFAGGMTLKAVDAAGGPVRVLGRAQSPAHGGTWGPDGTIVFGSSAGGLFTISASGGEPGRPDAPRPASTRDQPPVPRISSGWTALSVLVAAGQHRVARLARLEGDEATSGNGLAIPVPPARISVVRTAGYADGSGLRLASTKTGG